MARTLMIISGVIHIAAGVLFIFIPEELFIWSDGKPGEIEILAVSLFGTSLFGFGIINYTGRNAIYGGIYGKPIILGNFIFHTVAAVHLLKFTMSSDSASLIFSAITGALYLLFAAGFIRLNFFPPVLKTQTDADW
jgi:hypothetical protein